MVPCITRYEMEKQLQAVYTISKFREVQEEFFGKVYCEHIFVKEGCSGTTYELSEDVMHDHNCRKKNIFRLIIEGQM